MSVKDRLQSSAAAPSLIAGMSALYNASLKADFYPDDLPADWRLSYYANEFQTLLLTPSDMPGTDDLSASLSELSDELDEDFILLFDISSCSQSMRAALLTWQKQSDFPAALLLVDMKNLLQHNTQPCFPGVRCLLAPIAVNSESDTAAELLVCLVNDSKKLSPRELRELIEMLRIAGKTVIVLFSILENARNAIMLETMM